MTAAAATAPLLVVRRPAGPVEPPVSHPLATRRGVELFGLILAAGEHWRPLTKTQRAALRRGYLDLIRTVRDVDATTVPDEGLPIDLPALPGDVHAATARSLQRRGLVDNGRLTMLAIGVVRYADHDRRPVTTARTIGGAL